MAGIENPSAFTTIFIPSHRDIALKGLNALSVRKTRRKPISIVFEENSNPKLIIDTLKI